MRTTMNLRMRGLLEQPEVQGRLAHIGLAPELESIIESGIVEAEGCTFLRALVPDGFDAQRALAESCDRTDCEMAVNERHVQMMLGSSREWQMADLLGQSYEYARRLAGMLQKRGEYKVLLSFRDDEFGPDCVVGFHGARPGEDWLEADLEGYKEDAVLVLDTQPESRRRAARPATG